MADAQLAQVVAARFFVIQNHSGIAGTPGGLVEFHPADRQVFVDVNVIAADDDLLAGRRRRIDHHRGDAALLDLGQGLAEGVFVGDAHAPQYPGTVGPGVDNHRHIRPVVDGVLDQANGLARQRMQIAHQGSDLRLWLLSRHAVADVYDVVIVAAFDRLLDAQHIAQFFFFGEPFTEGLVGIGHDFSLSVGRSRCRCDFPARWWLSPGGERVNREGPRPAQAP